MPYSAKFERVLQARKHGARLDDPDLMRISPQKAGSMLSEAEGAEKSALATAAARLKRRKAR